MGRYFYPSASDALSAKKQFLREHGYKIPHCFKNSWGSGYVLFDSKSDVNSWYKEHTGEFFYKEEYEPGTIFTKQDAYREIDKSYGEQIETVIRLRNFSFPKLALGLPSIYGNRMFLKFVLSSNESDIEGKFYIHYDAFIIDASKSVSACSLRDQIKAIIYKHFYNSYFKKRIEGSAQELERRERAQRAAMAERDRIEKERKREQQRLEQERIQKQRELQEESKPKINTFTISSNSCFVGDQIVLKWDIQNYDLVYLNGQLQYPNDKTKIIKFNTSGTKKLTLKIVKNQEEVTKTISIDVISKIKDKIDYKEEAEKVRRELAPGFGCIGILIIGIFTLSPIVLPFFIFDPGKELGLEYIFFIGPILSLIWIFGLFRLVSWASKKVHRIRIKSWKQAHPNDPRAKYL